MPKNVNIVTLNPSVAMINIYKASAGSGKTYALTGKYLLILFQKYFQGNRSPYKNILAVTFTNKATDQMKQRILKELYILSTSPDTSSYASEIMAQLAGKINDSFHLKNVAEKILFTLLNDYSAFNISTIDRFFQQVLRSFAKELGYYSSYSVELDQEAILSLAVDELLNKLEDKKDLLSWLILMSESAVEEGKSWNIQPQILDLGKNLFSEEFKLKSKDHKDLLKDRSALREYRSKMRQIINDFKAKAKDYGCQGEELLNKFSLQLEDFSYGKNSAFSYFNKLKEGSCEPPGVRFRAAVDSPDKWTSKTAKAELKATVLAMSEDGMNSLMAEVLSFFTAKDYEEFTTALKITESLDILGVLYDISESVVDYCKENNLLLLPETTEFLNKIIDGSDTPFVYEKIGSRIENYLLDEFQDTSTMQWSNFYPLLRDSVDSNNENLIVGDVKQSIYRWRNSDWRLLNSQVALDFKGAINEKVLDTNWRSREGIINFNNAFFKSAVAKVQSIYNALSEDETNTSLLSIYSDVAQNTPKTPKSGGIVSLNFFTETSKDGEDKELRIPNDILAQIQKLQALGYSLNDIAILVQKNSQGEKIARFLIDNSYNVVSEDSLFISSSVVVNKIVSQIRNLSAQSHDPIADILFSNETFVPTETSLYNICEEIIRLLSPDELKEQVFIQAFLDLVSDYVANNTSDILGFLQWWDDSGVKKSISVPEGEQAIRIMTIHKSKGLDFKIVIIPFFEAKLYKEKGKLLWCTPKRPPFDNLPLVPIKTGSSLVNTIFKDEYIEELKYSYIDALNVSYVAFTRAVDAMFIYMDIPEKLKEVKSISEMLAQEFLSGDDVESETLGDYTINRVSFPKEAKLEAIIKSQEEISACELKSSDTFYSQSIDKRLELSTKAANYIEDDSSRLNGILMHEILSRVLTKEDIRDSLEDAQKQGKFLPSTYQQTYDQLVEKIESVEHLGWYDRASEVLNEASIISPTGDLYIPDRVVIKDGAVKVIDYKFGKLFSAKYKKQVLRYMALLKEMGYDDVSGFIWYFQSNKVEEVS